MEVLLASYEYSIWALGYVAALMLVQLLVADVVGIAKKHVPGTVVESNHSNILFRTARTVGNVNESIGIFICGLLFCLLTSASPQYTAYAAWGYATSRTLYAVCYYANLQTLRSVVFGFSLLSLVALIVVGLLT
ncbi:MAG: MAPEG family protein [Halioglobus sp.]